MASIDALSPDSTTTAPPSTSSAAPSSAQSQQNEFLQLLVAQLQSQNPLDPMDGTQFVSQLAEFSSLQELTGMHTDLNNIQSYLQPATTGTTTSSTDLTNPTTTTNTTNPTSTSNPFKTLLGAPLQMSLNSFTTALSGLEANTEGLSVVGNNIANLNTIGFKESDISFADVLDAQVTAG